MGSRVHHVRAANRVRHSRAATRSARAGGAASHAAVPSVASKSPFGDIGDKSKWEIYAKVAKGGKIKFPGFVSQPARDLISQLLTRT